MQTAKLPVALCDEIDKVCRKFVWGHEGDNHKIHLVNWATVKKPKDCGGLGIRPLRLVNKAALAKLSWHFLQEPESLWCQVLRSKYRRAATGLDVFHAVLGSSNLYQSMVNATSLIRSDYQMEVQNGSSTAFWLDSWLMDSPLYECAISEIPLDEIQNSVAAYWHPSGWRLDALQRYLPIEILSMLCDTRLSI